MRPPRAAKKVRLPSLAAARGLPYSVAMPTLTAHRREILRLLGATLFFGAASGIFASTLNNYLAEVHGFGAEARGWLEFPRELPGFLLVGVVGLLSLAMRETKMAGLAMLCAAAGAVGLGHLAPSTALLVVWVALWSLGDHILFAVDGPIGLRLAKEGGEGRRLGQLGGARNLGTILGVSLVFALAKLRGNDFGLFYVIAAALALIAGGFYLRLHTGRGEARSRRLVYRKEYGLFYAISALFGIRKQIFLVFGSWVLVALHGEAYYRRLESEALDAVVQASPDAVVATGGSIVTHPENFARLRAAATTVWLRARPEDHWDRVIQQGDRRPMRDHPHAMAELRALLAARAPLYQQADLTVDTAGVSLAAVIERVSSAIRSSSTRRRASNSSRR